MNDVAKFLLLFLLIVSAFAVDEEEEVQEKQKIKFSAPNVPADAYFTQYFTSKSDLLEKWVVSLAKKDGVDESISQYNGKWSVEVPESSAIENDFALVLKSKAKHHAISAKMAKTFTFEDNELVVQYEVKFQNGLDCGGAYVKLLTDSPALDLSVFNDKTPYTIMFGPDKCGLDSKLHFIFRHKHPKTGVFEEKQAKKVTGDLEKFFTDKKTHLYTLVVRADNSFEIYVDQTLINSGNLLSDFTPSVNPDKEIADPDEKKPEEWDERQKIVDEKAVKPDDWDENALEFIIDENAVKPEGWLDNEPDMISDPTAVKPKDWDQDMDGEWEAPKVENPACKSAPGCGEWKKPKIRNPAYKGKWTAPMIDNPAYSGIWKPRLIPNPDYFEDKQPYKMTPFSAVGLELWSMSEEIAFDNFIIVGNKKIADDFAAATWIIKRDAERIADPSAQSVVDAVREAFIEKPWMLAAILGAVLLPLLILCIYFCRSSKSTPTSRGSSEPGSYSTAAAAQRKKTDAPSPDDMTKKSTKVESSDVDEEDSDDDDSVRKSSAPSSAHASPKASPSRNKQAVSATKGGDTAVTKSKADLEEESDGEQNGTSQRQSKPTKRRTRKE